MENTPIDAAAASSFDRRYNPSAGSLRPFGQPRFDPGDADTRRLPHDHRMITP